MRNNELVYIMRQSIFFITFVIICKGLFAQPLDAGSYTWWRPAENSFPVVGGQAWPSEVKNTYDRLPARAEKNVRPPVWGLSQDAAGLTITFQTDAPEILIRYKVQHEHAFPHMPATGVSGLDLYAVSSKGAWQWCGGKYSFGDTITYRYKGLEPNESTQMKGREYRLYLPLYNAVSWLEIGVPVGNQFKPQSLIKDKPIVIYGSSIVQGGCASRPGMAWTAILGRKLNLPVINLGFSGNGLLEKEIIDLMAEIDAQVYVLDCLPNLVSDDFSDDEVKNRVLAAVKKLRQEKNTIPILLIEHDGYSDARINAARAKSISRINHIQQEAFKQLLKEGVTGLTLLSMAEIGQDPDGTVDGTHPTDLGMLVYARAVDKKLRHILKLK